MRGPNFWSIKKHKLIQLVLDLEDLEYKPTNKIPGFYERIQQMIPSLYNHFCSENAPGGFFERVKDGTWMGHVIEHIALELQSLAGLDVGFGRTRGTGKEGVYNVVFSYNEEKEGLYTAKAAIRIADALVKGTQYDVKKDIEEIKRLWYNEKLGPSTSSIVAEAGKRHIPFIRLDDSAYVQLGYGAKQKRIDAAMTNHTSLIAVEIAGNKDVTKKVLQEAFVPVPHGQIIDCVDNLKDAIEEVGFPLVVKPLDGNQGKGATTNITNWQEVTAAFLRAKEFSDKVIIEKFIIGEDFRALVVNGKFVAAALRTPASVTGDGIHTIQELIDIVNTDPRRGSGHENILTCIKIDEVTSELLTKKNYSLQSVLPKGQVLHLKPTANLSTGGTATDVTDTVHASNIKLFERIAGIVGLDICGIDIMAPALNTPIKKNGGAVIEVNAAPGLRMHLHPNSGKPRNVAKHIVDMLFPSGDGRIPIVAITGTNGKTTTTRLLARMVQNDGFVTGYTTTDGIYINNELINDGDSAGPSSAQVILKDITVDFAVLECARGGLLRSGLAFDECDCAIVTNVAEDHLGLGGIHTLEQLAKVKSVVPETVKEGGYAILNADDDLVYAMKERVKCKVAFFSLYPDNLRIEQHCAEGGLAAFVDDGYILLRRGRNMIPIEEIKNIPITFGGMATFNIYNVLAATLAAYTSKINLNTISQTLRTFIPSFETTPGRMNEFSFTDFTVLLDYAHNPHALKSLGDWVKSYKALVKTGIITGVGDRRDEDIITFGEQAAKIFDHIIIRHDKDLRGRGSEEISNLLQTGIHNVDPGKPIEFILNECEAVEHAIVNAIPNSLIVILSDKIEEVYNRINDYLQLDKEKASGVRTLI